jgi:hypothetical protein
MNSIQFIGTHLRGYKDSLQVKIYNDLNAICAFTGQKINQGFLLKDAIGDNFTDFEYLKFKSEYTCLDFLLCTMSVIPQSEENKQKNLAKGINKTVLNSLRNYSFLCTEKELIFLKREDVLQTILNIQNIPFIIGVSYSFKKHISFKTQIQYSNKDFIVFTDKGKVNIKIQDILILLPIIQAWYTVQPDKINTSTKPTFFSKEDILNGTNNLKKIEDYGLEKYYQENKIIEKYRKTMFLDLLVHILNKKEK